MRATGPCHKRSVALATVEFPLLVEQVFEFTACSGLLSLRPLRRRLGRRWPGVEVQRTMDTCLHLPREATGLTNARVAAYARHSGPPRRP